MKALVNDLRLESVGKGEVVAFVKQLAALDTGAKIIPGMVGGTAIKRHDGSMVSFTLRGTEIAWSRTLTTTGTVPADADDSEAMYDLISQWNK